MTTPETRPAAGRLEGRIVLPALVLWVLLVRLPAFDPSLGDADEALFLLIGGDWDRGVPPYAGIWDVKPPGLFALFALVRLGFTPGIMAARALTALAVLATTLGLWHIARRHLAGRWTPLVAALAYPPATMILSGLRSVPELLMAPFLVAAIGLALDMGRAPLRRAALAGLACGAAVMIKQTAAFESLLAFALVAAATRRGAALFAAAALLPAAALLALLRLEGEPLALALTPFTAAAGRVGDDGISLGAGLVNFLAALKPLLPLVILSAMLWPERRALAAAPDRRAIRIVLAWLVLAAAAVVLMHASYPHYLIPLLPPLVLASAAALNLLAAKAGPRAGTALALGTAVLVAYPVLWWHEVERPGRFSADLARAVAARLGEAGLRPGESIYVADQDPAIYLLTGAAVPTRFALPFHLMCDVPLPAVDPAAEIARILASRPRFVVISHTRREMVCQHADRTALVDAALGRDYRPLARVEAAGGAADLYCRSDDCPGG